MELHRRAHAMFLGCIIFLLMSQPAKLEKFLRISTPQTEISETEELLQ